MDITPRFEPEPPSEDDVFEVDDRHIEEVIADAERYLATRGVPVFIRKD